MFVSKYTNQFLLATIVIVVLAGGVLFKLGLPLGIDFTGGALTEVSYSERPEAVVLEDNLTALGLDNSSIRETTGEDGRPGFILRTRNLSEAERQQVKAVVTEFGEGGEITRFTSIGPVLGEELKRKAIWAIAFMVALVVLYVAYSFRRVSTPVSSWTYGSITIVALLHDVLVPTAAFSILARLTGAEVNVLFVTALLAVLGYSVNDTIVVFDRVRENIIAGRKEKRRRVTLEGGVKKEIIEYTLEMPFAELVGKAVRQTMTRSINTSVTTFLALLALYLLGGDTTHNFALMLMVGVLAGTYSSIFIANPILIWWAKRKETKAT